MISKLHSTQWFSFIIVNNCIKLNVILIRSTKELVTRNSYLTNQPHKSINVEKTNDSNYIDIRLIF